jgi:ribose 5-phosphate isomerase A
VTAAERALAFVADGHTVGLGTGRAATGFVEALGARVAAGLRVRAVATSGRTETLARRLGIPLATLDETGPLDLCVDGADEVDPQLDLIKGYGGALVREKVVAAFAARFVVVVGAEKLVRRLGARGRLPVEVVPFARAPCERRLTALGLHPSLRLEGGRPQCSDNGNHILDCSVSEIDDPAGLERAILAVPGVVGTGLFLGMAHCVLVEEAGAVRVHARKE